MKTALLVIDIQKEYFPGGKAELFHPIEASQQARRLLEYFRQQALPRYLIQHISLRPGALSFLPDSEGIELHPNIALQTGDTLVVKHFPNSFRETILLEELRANQVNRLVICGMMTHMCVDATTRAAYDLGYNCMIASDACATRNLSFGEVDVPSSAVHAAFLAALQGMYAQVMPVDALLLELSA